MNNSVQRVNPVTILYLKSANIVRNIKNPESIQKNRMQFAWRREEFLPHGQGSFFLDYSSILIYWGDNSQQIMDVIQLWHSKVSGCATIIMYLFIVLWITSFPFHCCLTLVLLLGQWKKYTEIVRIGKFDIFHSLDCSIILLM